MRTLTSLYIFHPGSSSVHVKVELDSVSVVGQEHIGKARKFGVNISHLTAPIDAKKYMLAFIQRLFLQREELYLGQLTDYLESGIANLWQEVLLTLEKSSRKLLAVQSGSLLFTLFCPTINSVQELRDDCWLETLTQKMEQLVHEIGR